MWEIQNNRLFAILVITLGIQMISCKADPSFRIEDVPQIMRLDSTEVSTAGDPIKLAFICPKGIDVDLQLDNSYGSVLLRSVKTDNGIEFILPDPIIQLAGQCTWKLLHENQLVLSGNISILPQIGSRIINESYLGPKDIIAGTSGNAMVVSIPTDQFDNPLPDGTPLQIEKRYKGQTVTYLDSIHQLINWRRIEPYTASGRIFVNSMAEGSPSVEMYTDISSGAGTDFEISYERNHDFADGNQVIRLKTSVIKDRFENTIADGTLVTFHIESSNAAGLYTNATTVNGVAVAKLVHPDAETNWKISALIAGVASSNIQELEFKSAVEDFRASFPEGTDIISIGPVRGFMGQLVPDFTPAEILISFGNEKKERITVYTRNGLAQFNIKTLLSVTPPIQAEIRILGRTQTINL